MNSFPERKVENKMYFIFQIPKKVLGTHTPSTPSISFIQDK